MTASLRLLRLAAVLLVVVLGAPSAGCGDDDQTARTTGGPSTTGAQRGTGGGPSAGGELVATLDVHGGFLPVEAAVADTADVVVLGDGTVVSAAPMTLQYPGPALAPLQAGVAPPAAVEELVAAIEALDPNASYEPPGPAQVADAPTTTVTLRRGGDVVAAVTAYALGLGGEGGEGAEEGPRRQLSDVVRLFEALPTGTGEQPYEPTALRVHDVTDQAGDAPAPTTTIPGDPAVPGEPAGRILDWPFAHEGRPCTLVEDPAEVAWVLAVLGGATQLDWFRTPSGVRRLVVAPLLPGDPGCTDT